MNENTNEKGICCICGKPYEGHGRNPYPVRTEQGIKCCPACDQFVVQAVRDFTAERVERAEAGEFAGKEA